MRKELGDLCLKAVNCRTCFRSRPRDARYPIVKKAPIDVAQPRWVGPKYESSNPRILLMLLNPGSGKTRDGKADRRFRSLIKEYRSGKTKLKKVFEHQEEDMPNWGQNKLKPFYLEGGLDLCLQEVAFANIAWCSSDGNKYPSRMLKNCFKDHTRQLIRILKPGIIILSGTAAQKFEEQVRKAAPNAKILNLWHYAIRGKSKEEKRKELQKARNKIRAWKRRAIQRRTVPNVTARGNRGQAGVGRERQGRQTHRPAHRGQGHGQGAGKLFK